MAYMAPMRSTVFSNSLQGPIMPGKTYWIGQFLLAAVTMFILLTIVGLVRSQAIAQTWAESLAWSLASSAIFIGSRYRKARKGEQCALCEDLGKRP
jgi:hypothetical protein